MAAADLDDISERLYALPPDDFTAARDAEAKRAGDKELRAAVKALRRPTVSAWLVNLLAAEQPELLDQLLDLGPALAAAQQEGRGDALRELGQQRRELVAAVAATAVGLADRPVTAQVLLEVEQTLEAALADPASAEAVRSSRLVRALTYAGFGGVDLEGAVAVVGSRRPARPAKQAAADQEPRSTQKPAEKDHGVAAAEAAALDAAAALDDAVRACEAAERERADVAASAAEATRDAERAAEDVARLEQELAAGRERSAERQQAADAARGRADAAAARSSEAEAAVAAAQEAAERARSELDRLRRA